MFLNIFNTKYFFSAIITGSLPTAEKKSQKYCSEFQKQFSKKL